MKQDQPTPTGPNPSGYCMCGCGGLAPISTTTSKKRGLRKGEPHRFIHNHHGRGRPLSDEHKRTLSEAQRRRKRTLTPETRRKMSEAQRGKKASPEARRKMSLAHGGTGETGYIKLHSTLARQYPKTGICEECGKKPGRTDYAFQRHPEPHTLDRSDYRELCPPCHNRIDCAARKAGVSPREIATSRT